MYSTDTALNTTSQTTDTPMSMATVLTIIGIETVLLVIMFVALWKIFTKAGEAGWKSLIPIYNLYIMFKISGMSGWWILLMLVPLVNVIGSILLSLNLAKSFGRSQLFGIVGLYIFGLIGFPILAFGESQYVGPAGNGGLSTPPVLPVAPTA